MAEPLQVWVAEGRSHWLGGECSCRPAPAQRDGFAGVVHPDPEGSFFEAQACVDHTEHDPSPAVIGLAADPICDPRPAIMSAHQSLVLARLTDREAVEKARAVMPSNLGGTDG